MPADENQAIVDAFAKVEALYIADGHHRAASGGAHAARALAAKGAGEHDRVLAVAFPDNQVQVLPYNRVVKDLNGMTPEAFLAALEARDAAAQGRSPMPMHKGQVAMYLSGEWHTAAPEDRGRRARRRRARDRDPAADARHHGRAHRQAHRFVGGIRGTEELERLVDSGAAAVAFSLYPVSVEDLMRDCRCRRHHAAEVDVVRAEAA